MLMNYSNSNSCGINNGIDDSGNGGDDDGQ